MQIFPRALVGGQHFPNTKQSPIAFISSWEMEVERWSSPLARRKVARHRREIMPTFSADDPTAEERLVVIAFVPPIPVFLLLELYCASLDPHARGEYHVRTHFKGIRWNGAAGKVKFKTPIWHNSSGAEETIGPGISEPNSKRGVVGQLHPLSAVAMCDLENCWNSDGQTLVETAVSLTILFSMVFSPLVLVWLSIPTIFLPSRNGKDRGTHGSWVLSFPPWHCRDQCTCLVRTFKACGIQNSTFE